MRLPLLICLITVFTGSYGQDFTNKGKDFWIGYGHHVRMATGGMPESMQLYITSDVNTTGQISIQGLYGYPRNFSVAANRITTIDIPRTAALTGEGLHFTGIHITAEKPVVVYSFIYVNAISGATLCLPTNTLGREYYSINFDQYSNEPAASSSYFLAIAADTGITTLEITPSKNTLTGRGAGVPFTVDLRQGQVYQVMSMEDLTGSSIRTINNGSGCKRIAVFCGSSKIAIGCGGPGTSDNLYQQMYPTTTWGKTYITVPSINEPSRSSQYNYFRVFRSDPSAPVKVNGTQIPDAAFIDGRHATLPPSNTPNRIESDKPIMVAQYFTTQGCSGNAGEGDPEMIYLNPVEQTVTHVTLNSMQPAGGTNIDQHFINVVLKNDPAAIQSFRIDGTGFAPAFKPHPNAPGYAYAQIPVRAGTHTVNCDTPFNAISYGFGNAESYGYSAGTNLKDLYQFVTIRNDYASVNFPAGCVRSPFKFSITFPYQPLKITWRFNGLFSDTTIQAPVYDSTWMVNGRQLYRYLLDTSYQIDATGTYPISLLVVNPTGDGCSGEQQVEYDLEIFDQPKADFSFNHLKCSIDSAAFTDQTDGLGRPVARWYWDFGNGMPDATSQARNPLYRYAESGTYTVRHAAITDVGCLSDTISKPVAITLPPVAVFSASTISCEQQDVTFTDQSTVADASLVKWNWNFGDGHTETQQHRDPVKHAYDTAGTYIVTLQVESSAGCVSDLFQQPLSVQVLPEAAFATPEVCLNDPFAAFTDQSTIADGSTAQLKHHWQFGDGHTSAQKNPQHKYAATGYYNVKLAVTSTNGCRDSLEKSFTVNGSLPKAGFAVDGINDLCSNREVVIRDASTVDFGNIVRVEIYWDYQNDPAIKTVDEDPLPGKAYTHLYTDFGTPVTKDFRVRYVAYSGESCISQHEQLITVKASPLVAFTPLSAVCEEVQPFVITAASETHGFNGTGRYLGQGILPDGTFNPGAAGPGMHTIRYRFAAENGCAAEASQTQQVHPTPAVNAGPDKRVLEEGQVLLDGYGNGNGVRYSWSPAAGLNDAASPAPMAAPAGDTRYMLTVTTAEGCLASDEVFVKVLRKLVIPNAFSPNGDGINDTWVVKYLEDYPDCTVEIYNRYGQRVYYSRGYARPWDGTVNGRPLPVGTYYWLIHPKNGRVADKGSVTIIR